RSSVFFTANEETALNPDPFDPRRHKEQRMAAARIEQPALFELKADCRRPPPSTVSIPRTFAIASRFATDSPLEGAGFEPSVPRDTTKVSGPAHVACAGLPSNGNTAGMM